MKLKLVFGEDSTDYDNAQSIWKEDESSLEDDFDGFSHDSFEDHDFNEIRKKMRKPTLLFGLNTISEEEDILKLAKEIDQDLAFESNNIIISGSDQEEEETSHQKRIKVLDVISNNSELYGHDSFDKFDDALRKKTMTTDKNLVTQNFNYYIDIPDSNHVHIDIINNTITIKRHHHDISSIFNKVISLNKKKK